MDRKTICVDLNGVLDTYTGWKGPWHTDPPRPGAREFLAALVGDGYRVVVLTTREVQQTHDWLREHGMADYVAEVTNTKPPALVYVDDRAVCFRGNYEETLQEIRGFRAFWEQEKAPAR